MKENKEDKRHPMQKWAETGGGINLPGNALSYDDSIESHYLRSINARIDTARNLLDLVDRTGKNLVSVEWIKKNILQFEDE